MKVAEKLVKLVNLCLERNIPFVTYRLPAPDNAIEIWVQRSGKMLFVEDIAELNGKSGFVYAPFHRLTNFPVVFFEPEFVAGPGQIRDELINDIASGRPLYPEYDMAVPGAIGRTEYIEQARNMIRAFGSGLSKAVLSRVKLLEKPDSFNPGLFFLDLLHKYTNAFIHLINIPGAGCWMGASPEMLFSGNGEEATTFALAGTRKYTEAVEDEWGEKEMEEQEMVALHIEGVLRNNGISTFLKEGPDTVNAGNVQHLSTRFSFSPGPSSFDVSAFLKQLHPTPAVSGLPVEPALDLIRSTEKHNREYYAGFCGPLDFNGRTDLFVNLRCMKVMPNELAIYTGGGLTARSVPENEWDETEWKAKTLLSLI
jgi:isochorismate synthase